MNISFISDKTGPFIADLDGIKTNFIIDLNYAGLALPQNMKPSEKGSKNKLPIEDKITSIVANTLNSSNIVEGSPKIRNFGAPPEKSGIMIVNKIRALSDTVPECAERNGFWFYNRSAVYQLVKMGVFILSEEQLFNKINCPCSPTKKAKAMNRKDEPFPGYLDAENGKIYSRGDFAHWWVVSSGGSVRYCVTLGSYNEAFVSQYHPGYSFLVPVYE